MATSTAVGTERVSRIVGYKLKKGDFSTSSPNLPQRIAIFAEANHANQGTLDTDGKEITDAQTAGSLYGYGSPIYNIMRILRPLSGGGIGGIPTIVYAQAAADGAAYKVLEVTPTGTATANGTHFLKVAGRDSVDGEVYALNIAKGDTTDAITQKIEDAVNNVLGSPFIGTSTDYEATLTSKWKGLTAEDLSVTVDVGDNALGLTYAVASTSTGAGTPSVTAALNQFGNEWVTIVVNSYGTVSTVMDALESFNGIPNPDTPTGRYTGIVMKPFIALTGSVADNPSTITDARLDDVTIAICPAPLSKGLPMEAAANAALLFGKTAQNTPQSDIGGASYSDMPTPISIGSMSSYDSRDSFVKKGCSTVDLVSGRYQVQDFVTTYHPVGEVVPQYRFCRNLMLDFNVRYGYYLLELINVVDHVIAANDDTVNAQNVVKPKQWLQVVKSYAADLGVRALVADVPFMQDSITVAISTTNPDRLETFFRYKRTGIARIASTDAEAGFNFGTND